MQKKRYRDAEHSFRNASSNFPKDKEAFRIRSIIVKSKQKRRGDRRIKNVVKLAPKSEEAKQAADLYSSLQGKFIIP